MRVLCLGDIFGKPGRAALRDKLEDLVKQYNIDFVVVNGENSAGGAGITERIAKHFFDLGVDVITLGDHVWDQKGFEVYLAANDTVLRPANFPNDERIPGAGNCIQKTASGQKVGVINLIGRTFMRHLVDCPFRKADSLVEEIRKETPIIIVDFHAEATSEKVALGRHLEGRVSLVFGTHTHVQTADEHILPGGTAYITDLGMCGPYDSIIGSQTEGILQRFLTSMPVRFSAADKNVILCGAVAEIEESTGKATNIIRIRETINEDLEK